MCNREELSPPHEQRHPVSVTQSCSGLFNPGGPKVRVYIVINNYDQEKQPKVTKKRKEKEKTIKID